VGRPAWSAVVVSICYGPSDQEEVDEVFFKLAEAFKQLEEASHSQALILMEAFNHSDICQKDNHRIES